MCFPSGDHDIGQVFVDTPKIFFGSEVPSAAFTEIPPGSSAYAIQVPLGDHKGE